jgi:hypothetical protein
VRNRNFQVAAGAAAIAVLAGIGVLVWALGFRDNGKNASGLASPSVKQQSLAFPGFKGGNVTLSGVDGIHQAGADPNTPFLTTGETGVKTGDSLSYPLGQAPQSSVPSEGGITQAGANVVPLGSISAGDIMASTQSAGNGQTFSYSLQAANTTGKGIAQANTAPTVSLDQVGSVADSMFTDASFGAQGSLNYPITSANTAVPSGGGISQLQTAPMASLDSIASIGESLFSSATLGAQESFSYPISGANSTVPSNGGVSQLKSAPMQSFDSIASAGDLLFTDASLGAQGSFSYPITGANSTVPSSGGLSQLKTSPMQSFSSLGSVGDVMMAQGSFESQPFTPTGASAPNATFKLGAAARTLQATNATNATVGVVFCGALVNHRCSPQFSRTMPHTTKQLLVGFVWSAVPVGTKVQLVFFDVQSHKVIGKPTPVYSIPAASGGIILAGFRGPFPVLQLGVGALINGKPLKGAWVLNIT